jgi:hypothetical protein
MLCQNVRQILAGSFDSPSTGPENQEVKEHLDTCLECRKEEFYLKQVANAKDLLKPYEVSPVFNYRLQIRMAQMASRQHAALGVRPGIRPARHWSVSVAGMAALAVLIILGLPLVSRDSGTLDNPVALNNEAPPVQEKFLLPVPLFDGVVQASQPRPIRFKPETPLAAQYATALSEPLKPGVDGEGNCGCVDELVWMGDGERGVFVPVRRYLHSSGVNESVLLLPVSGAAQDFNGVY